jgi:hypothetical protein
MHVCDFYFASCFQISFAVQSWAAMLPCQWVEISMGLGGVLCVNI